MTATDLAVMALSSRPEFQDWLVDELEARERLYAMIGTELDVDVASLDALEAFLLGRYSEPDAALQPNQRSVLDGAARHIGLVMLLNVDGAEWDIELSDQTALYYRLPIIRLPGDEQECPLSLASAALDRRTGHYMRGVIESYEADYNAD